MAAHSQPDNLSVLAIADEVIEERLQFAAVGRRIGLPLWSLP